ncbi:uncharacterized protein N7500_006651 [Penicillium coprophilum]|uniref:uncharacterized protein n=1 Tax=Penicillium coprophilum TaxID=36646 RepID=UPI0023A18D7E|nr:uncharacterized protein N7500_006651 [Penicillium coprophilum]KAJ5164821.1 hypothetical protein N7500_006651 [Penicillium coprophilum]
MYDPNQEPFTYRVGDILGRDYYVDALVNSLSRHLPTELAVQVSNTNSAPIKMPVWKRRPGKKHLVIFLCYHATAHELEKTQLILEESLPAIFPAEMTRLDLIDFWDENRVWDAKLGARSGIMPLIYLRRPLSGVDRQFEIDQTVNQVVSDEYKSDLGHDLLHHLPFPRLKGFRYMRVPVHLAYSMNTNLMEL